MGGNRWIDQSRIPEASISDLWIKITQVSLEYASDDETGLVRCGKLNLRGQLRRMNLLRSSTKEDQDTSRQDWRLVVSGVNLRTLRKDPVFRATKFIPQVTLDRLHVDFTQQFAENLLYCMPAFVTSDEEPTMHILLLELIDQTSNLYRRIGIARAWSDEIRRWIMRRTKDEHTYPCDKYRHGKHLISIV